MMLNISNIRRSSFDVTISKLKNTAHFRPGKKGRENFSMKFPAPNNFVGMKEIHMVRKMFNDVVMTSQKKPWAK